MRARRPARGLVGLCILALSSARAAATGYEAMYVFRVFNTILLKKTGFSRRPDCFPRDAPSLGRLIWSCHERPIAAAVAVPLHGGGLVWNRIILHKPSFF